MPSTRLRTFMVLLTLATLAVVVTGRLSPGPVGAPDTSAAHHASRAPAPPDAPSVAAPTAPAAPSAAHASGAPVVTTETAVPAPAPTNPVPSGPASPPPVPAPATPLASSTEPVTGGAGDGAAEPPTCEDPGPDLTPTETTHERDSLDDSAHHHRDTPRDGHH